MEDANSLEQADIALGAQLAAEPRSAVHRIASVIGRFGDQEPLYAASAATIAVAFARRNPRLACAGISVLLAVAAADGSKRIVKRLITRTRPHVLFEQGRYEAEAGGSEVKPEQSFPSGHVAGTVAAARALSRIYPEAGPWSALATIVVAGARLAKGAHWPLDVAAGLVIGLAAEALSRFTACRLGQGGASGGDCGCLAGGGECCRRSKTRRGRRAAPSN